MVEAKLLRKKLKNGLIVDKWDLVTIIEKQQAEIEALNEERNRLWKDKLHPVKELTYEDGIEECAQSAEAYAYMSPNFTALAEELRAILRKAQINDTI